MPTVADVIARKVEHTELVCVTPDVTVLEAVRLMNDHHIGSVVVIEPAGRTVVGIFTERDLLRRVVAGIKDPTTTLVNDVMTKRVIVCEPETNTDELRSIMREKRVRHVPVIIKGRAQAMVSIGDLNMVRAEDLEQTVQYLELYLRS
jgi:CBS domain-containing protein